MKLIEQLIKKKLDLYEELTLNMKHIRALWEFYSCYSLAIAFLDIKDKDYRFKNYLFSQFIKSNEDSTSTSFKLLQKFVQKDMNVVLSCLKQIRRLNIENPEPMGNYYKVGTLGMIAWEYPED